MWKIAAAALAACLAAAPVLAGNIEGTARIVDGDTIELGGVTIRLAGIDAPERKTEFGPYAADTLRRMLKGRRVVCIDAGQPKTYGRTVARCRVDGRSVELAMIVAGAAWPYFRFLREPELSAYFGAAIAACRDRRGIWRDRTAGVCGE